MQAVADAVEALLKTQAPLNVFDGNVPAGLDKPHQYVAFYLTTPRPESARISHQHPVGAYTLTTMYVGRSPFEARFVAQKVHNALVRTRLEVPGCQCTPVTLGTAGQVRLDESINPPASIATDVWRFAITKE